MLAVQPGLVDTPLFGKSEWPRPATLFNQGSARLMGVTSRRGAISTIDAAAAPELDGGVGWGGMG